MKLIKILLRWTGRGLLTYLIFLVSVLIASPLFFLAGWLDDYDPGFQQSFTASIGFWALRIFLLILGVALFGRLVSCLYPPEWLLGSSKAIGKPLDQKLNTQNGLSREP